MKMPLGYGYGYEAPAYRQAGVSVSVKGLCQVLKTNNLTLGRYGHRYRCRWTKFLFSEQGAKSWQKGKSYK